MECNIEKLFRAIEEKQEHFMRFVDLFGLDDILTISALKELEGMEEAFRIVTETTVADYSLTQKVIRESACAILNP